MLFFFFGTYQICQVLLVPTEAGSELYYDDLSVELDSMYFLRL